METIFIRLLTDNPLKLMGFGRGVVCLFAAMLLSHTAVAQERCLANTSHVERLHDVGVAVAQFYERTDFYELRSSIDDEILEQIEPFLTASMNTVLKTFSATSMAEERDTHHNTKAPIPTGPVFHSNYEGMTSFRIADAFERSDDSIHVALHMHYVSPIGETDWTDVAVMRCEEGRWRLDDVIFDKEQTAGFSARSRLTAP